LEAIYFKRPLVVNNYSIYEADIKPKGFKVVEFDGFISNATLEETRYVLKHPEESRNMPNTTTNWRAAIIRSPCWKGISACCWQIVLEKCMKIALLHYSSPPIVGGVESVLAHHARLMANAGMR
jgi:hypothetical protein